MFLCSSVSAGNHDPWDFVSCWLWSGIWWHGTVLWWICHRPLCGQTDFLHHSSNLYFQTLYRKYNNYHDCILITLNLNYPFNLKHCCFIFSVFLQYFVHSSLYHVYSIFFFFVLNSLVFAIMSFILSHPPFWHKIQTVLLLFLLWIFSETLQCHATWEIDKYFLFRLTSTSIMVLFVGAWFI